MWRDLDDGAKWVVGLFVVWLIGLYVFTGEMGGGAIMGGAILSGIVVAGFQALHRWFSGR